MLLKFQEWLGQRNKFNHRQRAALSAPRQPNVHDDLESDDDNNNPGPGTYYNPEAVSDFAVAPYLGRNQYFGSTVERFRPQKVGFLH